MNNFSILSLIIFFSACSVGPDFKTPDVSLPNEWNNSSSEVQKKEPIVNWWSIFNDEVLVSLIDRATKENLDLKQAEERIKQTRALLEVSRSNFFPGISGIGNNTRSKTNSLTSKDSMQDDQSLLSSNSSIGDSYRAGFDALWEIDIFGRNRRATEASIAELRSSIDAKNDILISLQGEVATRYFNLIALQRRIEVAKKNLDLQLETRDITQKRFKVGFASKLDYTNAEAEVSTTASLIPRLEAEKDSERYSISILLGELPTSLDKELSQSNGFNLILPEVPLGLPSTLLRRRPDIRLAEAKAEAAMARVGVAIAELYPQFSLSGFIGVQGKEFASLGHWENNLWNFGSSIAAPIFQGGRLSASVDLQKALSEEAILEYKKTILNALKEVESNIIQYSNEKKRFKDLTRAVEMNIESFKLSSQLYIEGLSDFVNVINSQRALFATEESLVQSELAAQQKLIALFKSLGSGWE